ncbi:hypothetical protein VPNG_06196 [Cytospora leucostoma]|uniref:Uncharacterized protein n=1 Tax=Cytospora leucostoma TaxID=1230097 RepID=A0A423WYL7_9PEZI|nr:hypothetical protein VPNG_06196 [Cytospora leucostoma]
MSPSPDPSTLSPSSTMKPGLSVASTMEKSVPSKVTTTMTEKKVQRPHSRVQNMKAGLITWHQKFHLQFSMVGLAFLGFFAALGHHLYNASLNGQEVSGDAQWPPRYGSALAFFVRMVLVGSVQIAYKQQAWLAVKQRALKVSTLDAMFAVYYDPFQFANIEFLLKTTLPAVLAVISWALPLCAIASPSTLITRNGHQMINTTCPNVPVMNFTREIDYTLDGADDNLSGLAYWNINSDDEYWYTSPSMELERIFTLSTLSTAGPLAPANPCPSGTNCTYSIQFDGPAYGCEERADFGGPYQLYNKSQMAPAGDLLYASYSSLPMGPEDENGEPLTWYNMSESDPEVGVFTGLPSLWLGWATGIPDGPSLWSNLTSHIAECQMYNATYSFTVTFASGNMLVNNSATTLNGLLLPPGDTKSPSERDYLQFGSYHATGSLFRKLLSGNVTLGEDSEVGPYAITYTDATQTDLLERDSQLPTSNYLAAAIEDMYRNVFFSMMSDALLHDRQLSTVPCSVTSSLLVWNYEPFWLALSYCLAVGVTIIILFIGMHGFIKNGYAADASFSTFMATTRSKDVDELSRGSCLGEWPKNKEFKETRLRFGEIETNSSDHHAAFAFPSSIKGFDKRKGYGRRVESM